MLLPVCLWLLRGHHRRHERYLRGAAGEAASNGGPSHWTRKEVLRDPRFYLLLPVILAPSFISTGIFFHQVFLVEAKGWALESWAAAFVVFAAANVISGLAFGTLADRLGAPATLPWLLPPLALACLLLTISNDPLAAWGFMILAGVSMGAGNIFFGAFWPHVYGTAHLGSIRSLAFALVVFASALSPALMGAALDRGVSIETITFVCAAYLAVASVAAVLLMRLYRPRDVG